MCISFKYMYASIICMELKYVLYAYMEKNQVYTFSSTHTVLEFIKEKHEMRMCATLMFL